MARHYIPGKRTRKGERLFYSDADDWSPDRQTVYKETKSGGSKKVDRVKYDPTKKRFKK